MSGGKIELHLTSSEWLASNEGDLHLWYPGSGGTRLLNELRSEALDVDALKGIGGHFALVDLRGPEPLLVVDRLRSRALFYRWEDGRWLVTDDPEVFRDRPNFQLDRDAAEAFRHLSFVPGNRTLIQNVTAVEAGGSATLGASSAQTRIYDPMAFSEERVEDEEEFSSLFAAALDKAFARMLEDFPDKRFLVPLSGGLDSRLMLTWLKRSGAKDVQAFTYGTAKSEIATATDIARQMDVPIEVITYDPKTISQAWAQEGSGAFLRDTWMAASLPHVQDWYALRVLKEKGLLDEDTVVVPGHVVVGYLPDADLLGKHLSRGEIGEVLAKHHGSLQGAPEDLYHSPVFQESVNNVLDEVGYDGGRASIQSALEAWNLKESHAKYTNNSVKAYEHFGAAWAMPFLDREVWNAWFSGGEELTKDRGWYKRFVTQQFGLSGGARTDFYDSRHAPTKSVVESSFGRWLARSSLAPLITQAHAALVWEDHPLALQAFHPARGKLSSFLKVLSGRDPVGFWVSAFLKGKWGDKTEVVPLAK